MSTTCDLNVDWNKCPNCVRFKERIKDAEEASRAASANLDRAYAEYREDVAAGRACIATPRQRAWSSYLDDLEMEQSLASTRCTEAINAWATSIHRHHRLHEDRQQEAEDGKDVAADTDDAMPCTCAMCQAEDGEPAETMEMSATDLDEPFEKEDRLARELFGKLWYGDVPELELPKSYSTLRPMTLSHCARAIGLYKRMLKRYVPDLADNRPAWVAHRLMDAFEDAAEASEDDLSSPTPQERAEYYTERDQCDPDAGEREQARETARRVIAYYMGVPVDDIHIICSGVVGFGGE